MSLLARLRNTINQSWPPGPAFTEANVAPGSQRGRVFIVTGGNAGLGLELCRILYAAGATVYMATRSEERATAAIQAIVEQTTDVIPRASMGVLKFLKLDLADLETVKSAAVAFAQQESKLDVLINNAGQGGYRVGPADRTMQGLEPMMGMHCVATLLFTVLLLPQLRAAVAAEKAAGSPAGRTRVLWTSSGMAESGTVPRGVELDKLDAGTGDRVLNYSASRAGTWMLGRELALRHGGEGIVSVVVNPGNLQTNSWEGTPALLMWVLSKILLYPAINGAYTDLYAALTPDLTLDNNGMHIIPWGRLHPDEDVVKKDLIKAMTREEDGGFGYGKRLWEWCEEKYAPFA